jgi:hypothetical protein
MDDTIYNVVYANKYVIPSGVFADLKPISPTDDVLMEYQKQLMKELEERLWTVDRFLVDRSWDYPVYCSVAPFLYKTMS